MVPYHSQWGLGANVANADCGEAAALMIAQAYGKALDETVDDFVADIGDQAGWTDSLDLITLLKLHGLDANIVPAARFVEEPCLILVKYNEFTTRLDQSFGGMHWLVYLGHTATDVIVHDPDYWLAGGENKHYPVENFKAGFTGTAVYVKGE